MSRLTAMLDKARAERGEAVNAEVEEMNFRPADIPADVWNLIQENGRLATEALNDILSSPKFTRYKPTDQARLIALAQNRAYGQAKTNKDVTASKRGNMTDVTAATLRELAGKATLPEYKVLDAEVVEDKPLKGQTND